VIDHFSIEFDLSDVWRSCALQQVVAELMDHPIERLGGDAQSVVNFVTCQ
jgi:hypothetical protein